MPEIILKFPPLLGGRAGGINDADLETFSKDPNYYIARECAQNTLDAVDKSIGKAELYFDLRTISIDKLPCLPGLDGVFKSCQEYRPNDKKISSYCEKGSQIVSQAEIPVLIISDYNTTGLTGSDTDVEGKWYGLIKSEGSSNKDDDAGGSFGIGKAAPVAASLLRTVYYSTKTNNGYAFQGVSLQPTHKTPEGQSTQSVGYIGYYNDSPADDENYFPAVRVKSEIPAFFLREKVGTSIFVPGYAAANNWARNISVSLLNDFWLAILRNKIAFKIGDTIIDSSNVKEQIEKLKHTDGFTAYRYFQAYEKGTCFEVPQKEIGSFNLYLLEEEEFQDREVSYMRLNSMLIYKDSNFKFRKNFTGLFVCDDKEGNKILRAMEPPKHDEWQPKRLKTCYPELNGQKILDSIRKLINKKLKELMPLTVSPQFELSAIAKYLPYVDEEEISDENQGDEDNKETFKKIAASAEPVVIPVSKSSDMIKDDKGEEEIPGGSGGGKKPGPVRPGPNPIPGPRSGPRPSTGTMTKIKSRILTYSSKDKYYLVVLTAQDADFEGNLYLHSVGDDNEIEKVRAESGVCGGEVICANTNGSVPLKLIKDTPQKIKILVENNEELSLRFTYGS